MTPLTQLPPGEFDRLVQALIDRRLPAFSYWGREEVDRGLLASLYLDTDLRRLGRRVALHVQRILAGEDAGGLPVDFRRNRRLTLNMATARAIGVHPDWRVMTEAEVLHSEPPNVARRLSLAAAAREAVAANLDLAAADRSVAAGRQAVRAARAALRPQITASGGVETIDRDRAESSFGPAAGLDVGRLGRRLAAPLLGRRARPCGHRAPRADVARAGPRGVAARRGARSRGRLSGRAAGQDLRADPAGEPHPHPIEPRAGTVAPADRRRPRVRGGPLGEPDRHQPASGDRGGARRAASPRSR